MNIWLFTMEASACESDGGSEAPSKFSWSRLTRATAVASQALCGRYCEKCSMELSSFPISKEKAVLTLKVVDLNELQ
jgi:hypothetical protein